MKTKLKVAAVSTGKRADIGPYKIDRVLPNRYSTAIGPFVFMDHALPITHSKENTFENFEGTGPHPHRGIATLTYVLNGQSNHFDSRGNHALVNSGGVQWMKSGNGIIHDESLHIDPNTDDRITHSFQFWLNLPSKNKAEEPEYMALKAPDIAKKVLDNNSGWLKIIAGSYEDQTAAIPAYTNQFLYHLHLEAEKVFSLDTESDTEYAVFLLHDAVINGTVYHAGDLVRFEQEKGEVEIKNLSGEPIDILLFGGEPYTEPIVAHGPFVMNTEHEISIAYNDYYNGKYGEINYDQAAF